MEPSLSPAFPDKEQASLSASLARLRRTLIERSQDKDFFETKVDDQFHCLTFTNALILSSLSKDEEMFELRERLCTRLEQEIGGRGTANYHLRSVPGATASPYPDDLDDTFCVLSAIFLHDKQRLSGEKLAQATLALTTTEVEPGGPYRTWLVGPEAASIWRDVDPVVNANIAYFLKLNGIRLPKLDTYINDQLSLPASPYYPTPLHVLYFIARAVEGTKLVKRLEDTLSTCQPTNILEQALLISSLVRCQAISAARALMPAFLQELEAGHGLDPLPICVDTVSGNTKHFAVCAELTAAMCLEALVFLETTIDIPPLKGAQLDPSLAIIATAKLRLNTSDDPVLQTLTESFLTKLTNIAQVRELTTMPLDFAQAWNQQTRNLPAQTLHTLSVAHLLGWVAYTLYDDMIDGDGTPALLSVANVAARQMYRAFADLELDSDFQRFATNVLDGMDEANAWELINARLPSERLPDYSNDKTLYGRSGGIMLSSVAVLRLAGYAQTSAEVVAVTHFFKHYLAAKQLNDDAHDWQDDLTRGHISSVVNRLLRKYGQMYSPNDLKQLQSLFWQEVIQEVCNEVGLHVTQARAAMQRFGAIDDPSFFSKLIEPLEDSMHQALREREQSLAFLNTFTDPKSPTARDSQSE